MSNSKDNVINVNFKASLTEKLTDEILELIFKNSKDLTFYEAIGVLETVKFELFALTNDGGDIAS